MSGLASAENAVRELAHRADGDAVSARVDPLGAIGHGQRLDLGDLQTVGGLRDVREDGVEGSAALLSLALYEDTPRDGTIVLGRGATGRAVAGARPRS